MGESTSPLSTHLGKADSRYPLPLAIHVVQESKTKDCKLRKCYLLVTEIGKIHWIVEERQPKRHLKVAVAKKGVGEE